jgi:hypothetical protein
LRPNSGNERVGAHPPSEFKPKSSRDPGVRSLLTFRDAALRFVTSRRQNRGGNGGRAPVYFFPEAALEGMGGKPAPRLPLSSSTVTS